MIGKPPKIVIPGMSRGAGIPAGCIVGRRRGTGQGPAELLDLKHLLGMGIATTENTNATNSTTASTAHSETQSLSSSVSTSLSQISSSVSGAVSQITSLSTAVSSVDSGQSVSLSQVSSSLSGAISSTTSLSTAVSTVISGSISTVNSRIDSLSTAGGGGGATTFLGLTDTPASYAGAAGKVVTVNAGETGLEFDAPAGGTGQSTSLSQISSSLSGAISSTSSLSAAVSTVDSNQSTSLSQISSSLSTEISVDLSRINSLSTAVSKRVIGIEIDGGGSTITTGFKGYSPRISAAHTITKVTVLSIDSDGPATSCSITVDVWVDTYANFPPTSADKISASAPATLSSASKSEDSTLTGWTTSIPADSIYGFSVASVTGAKKILVEIEATF